MSKERARRRAEERAKKRAPKSPTAPTETDRSTPKKKTRRRSAREQRQRRRLWVIAIVWLVANAVIFVLVDTWNARWLGLTITTILVPLIVWLLWDPEGRVDL
jgi:Flp pilus assembly protein TadB